MGGVAFFLSFKGSKTYDGPTAEAKTKRLQVTIVERGTLESAENSDIICRVKATTKGSGVATTIKWVIADGSHVKKWDKLIELDDSALQDQLRDQVNKVTENRAKWVEAVENLKIAKSQNFSDIEKSKTDKVLAEIDVRKYLGERAAAKVMSLKDPIALQKYLAEELRTDAAAGDADTKAVSEYINAWNEIEGRLEVARSDREMWLDRAAWSQRMVKRGLLMRSQADSDKFRLESAEINLRKVEAELDILRKYTMERMVTDLWSKMQESHRALERVKTQANAVEIQKSSDLDSKHSLYHQELEKQREIEYEIEKCTIYSPQDGMVVYFVPESSFRGGGTQQSIIQEGEPVRDGQKLMRIPNLTKMMVNTRVHEAMVSKVRGESYQLTGFRDALRVGMIAGTPDISVVAPLFAYDLEARDDYREYEKVLTYSGQSATVRIDAFSSKGYKGRVKSVATVASQTDFISSEVKVYTTMIAIDEEVEGLKPGMSAEVTILADQTEEEVLVVPIQSVVGTISMGAKRKVFVIDERGRPQERDIEVGLSNDKEVEVKSGLNHGEKVALNPRILLGDKSDMKAVTPGKSRGASGGGEGGPGGAKGGKKKNGAAGAPGDAPGGPPADKAFRRPDGEAPPFPSGRKE